MHLFQKYADLDPFWDNLIFHDYLAIGRNVLIHLIFGGELILSGIYI